MVIHSDQILLPYFGGVLWEATKISGSRSEKLLASALDLVAQKSRTRREWADHLQQFVFGQPTAQDLTFTIDFDAKTFIPVGWEVREEDQLPNRVRGQVDWDPSKVKLYFAPTQQGGNPIQGHKLREELKDQPVYGAQMLDFLLANPQLIPEELKGEFWFFWDTIYRRSDGNLYVRCLDWHQGQWDWSYSGLGQIWDIQNPAAISEI